jgi:hypothetical protein
VLNDVEHPLRVWTMGSYGANESQSLSIKKSE